MTTYRRIDIQFSGGTIESTSKAMQKPQAANGLTNHYLNPPDVKGSGLDRAWVLSDRLSLCSRNNYILRYYQATTRTLESGLSSTRSPSLMAAFASPPILS